jgi:hypothetical protein
LGRPIWHLEKCDASIGINLASRFEFPVVGRELEHEHGRSGVNIVDDHRLSARFEEIQPRADCLLRRRRLVTSQCHETPSPTRATTDIGLLREFGRDDVVYEGSSTGRTGVLHFYRSEVYAVPRESSRL